jgi:hypothetical protein
LSAAFFEKWLAPEVIHLGKPLAYVRNDGFQENTVTYPADPHAVALKPKLFRKSDRLAPSVAEQLRNRPSGHQLAS